MARLNVASRTPLAFTYEGGKAVTGLTPIQQLRRSVLSCLLWEDEFYEDGEEIGARIVREAKAVSLDDLASLALEARNRFYLRHVPLLLAVVLAGRVNGHAHPQGVSDVVAGVIGRVDELAEIVALYWKLNPNKMLSRQMRKGLARAFAKFDRYQFGKYDFDKGKAVKLRDVLKLARPKPADAERSALYKAIKEGTVEAPDTWETALMRGADKKETFTRLIAEERLGYLALLRNLRKMQEVGVDPAVIRDAIVARKGARFVWPFRYVAAARAAPQFEPALDQALIEAIGEMPVLPGKTFVLVDVSGSMDAKMSGKSELMRIDAAATLASIIPGDLRVFTFSQALVEVPPRRGMAGVDAIKQSQPHASTYLGAAVAKLNTLPHDRLIVITDEQSHDAVPDPVTPHAYLINVASNQNGVGYRRWTHIDGFADSVLRFIREIENNG
jgi:hypothetical protein